MDILLKSKPIKITSIKRKTQAKMLCNLVVGDIIQLSIKASRAGSNKGTYASHVTVEHLKTGDKTGFSFNQISTLYNAFELEEVEENFLDLLVQHSRDCTKEENEEIQRHYDSISTPVEGGDFWNNWTTCDVKDLEKGL